MVTTLGDHKTVSGDVGAASMESRVPGPTHGDERKKDILDYAGEGFPLARESSNGCLKTLLGKRERQEAVIDLVAMDDSITDPSEEVQGGLHNGRGATPPSKRRSTSQAIVDDFDQLFQSPEVVFEFDKTDGSLDTPTPAPSTVSHPSGKLRGPERSSDHSPSPPPPPSSPACGAGHSVGTCDHQLDELERQRQRKEEEEEEDIKRAVKESLKVQVSESRPATGDISLTPE